MPLGGDQHPVTDGCAHEHVEVVSSGPIGEHVVAGATTQRALCRLCKRQVQRHLSGGAWTAWETMHHGDAGA